jgi:hypothetical protein
MKRIPGGPGFGKSGLVCYLRGKGLAMPYTTRPLDASTWGAFAELIERNNGVYGGCWCMGYHPDDSRTDAALNRASKERRVREDRAHAALVFDESGTAQGWCQYGSPEELPKIKRQVGKHAWIVSKQVSPPSGGAVPGAATAHSSG